MRSVVIVFFMGLFLVFFSCNPDTDHTSKATPLFQLLPPEQSNIQFVNHLEEGLNTNVLMYEYFYNGAGVAAADLNNDGLEDLLFTGNMEDNALYLNEGNLKFKEVAKAAGITGRPGPWKTGVSAADINGDGLIDLYVCYSGKMAPQRLINQLFINRGPDKNGIPHFMDMTSEYGLDFPTNTTHAVFFDFDNDGDLDLLLLNHHPDSLPNLDEDQTNEVIKIDDPQHGVRLLRNDNNRYVDVTRQAGIISSPVTYGLGAGISDINGDGWDDFYICNDFSTPDYLYINNGDGTFTDKLGDMLGHTSYASMGNNVSDINNDGLIDIFSLDMLPPDNHRQKLLLAPNDIDFFEMNVKMGFHHQYLRSMLHLNNGNGTFSEIGLAAGIDATDWSWAPLFADFDNDGRKDLFITNGYLRDYTNMDFLHKMDRFVKQNQRMKREDVLSLVHQMPKTVLHNFLFRNTGNASFEQANDDWGMTQGSYSNGAVYVDLDNDGDLEVVTNNINKPAFIFENKSNELTGNHYLRIKLLGKGKNSMGYGAKVYVFSGGVVQLQEQQPARGYESSVSPILNFGLRQATSADSLHVIWPGGNIQKMEHVQADRLLVLKQKNASEIFDARQQSQKTLFTKIDAPLDFQHQQPQGNDFKRQPLMVHAKSYQGPCMATGTVDGHGNLGIFIGGAAGQAGALFVQIGAQYIRNDKTLFEADKQSDDVDALFFDANGDGAQDLYVCSGGYHQFQPSDAALQDRLYINDGKGHFSKSTRSLPAGHTSSGCVTAHDINNDGAADLVVGGFVVPGRYPEAPRTAVLINDGKGHFSDATADLAPDLAHIGMVSDVVWGDLNGDETDELVVAGHWMPVSVFVFSEGKLVNRTTDFFDKPYRGLWNKIFLDDLDGDGYNDLLVGNQGINTRIKAEFDRPADLYYKDFDNNGTIDPVFCFYTGDKSYPFITRKELIAQMPMMAKRFPTFGSYADATIDSLFSKEVIRSADHLRLNTLRTTLFMNKAGKMKETSLPEEVQYAPVYTITKLDDNHDGQDDLLLCGNVNHARILFGKIDANYGLLLQGDGHGAFRAVSQNVSGFTLKGDVRSCVLVNNVLLFGINNHKVEAYRQGAAE